MQEDRDEREDEQRRSMPVGAEAPPEVPARWSAARKIDVVLRLMRGAPVDVVARETQVPAHELEACHAGCSWRRGRTG